MYGISNQEMFIRDQTRVCKVNAFCKALGDYINVLLNNESCYKLIIFRFITLENF